MNNLAGSECVSSYVGHLVSSPGSQKGEVCSDASEGSQLRVSSLVSSLDPNPAQLPSPISPALESESDVAADSSVNNPMVGLSSSILLSTSADVLPGIGSSSCNLVANSSPRSSPAQSISPLPEHLESVFTDLANVPGSEPSTTAELQSRLLSGDAASRSSDILGSFLNAGRDGSTNSQDLSSPRTVAGVSDGPVADELDSMVSRSFQSNTASELSVSIVNSSTNIATSSGDQIIVTTGEHEKLEVKVQELEHEILEEGELEDGELSAGWESGEDDEVDDEAADPIDYRDDKYEDRTEEPEEEGDEGIFDYRTEGLTPVVTRFAADVRMNQTSAGGAGSQLGKVHKKNNKRRKGKGALSRQRKKSRLERALKVSNEATTEFNADGGQQGDRLAIVSKQVESIDTVRRAGEKQQKGSKKVETDAGVEEGEVIEEDNRGLLSQLVEEEVGLWTTDVGDEQISSSKIDSDEDGKKKTRAPISAERKLKKKIAFRRKRAEKEKELGIRRPRLPVNTFKPKVPLCKFYIKGRCTLGGKCTFSHDVVPVTKSDPCKFFMVNRCLKGDDCPFSHTLDTFPCKFWHTRGHCLDGSNCRFSHGPLTNDQRQNLAKRIEHDTKEQQTAPSAPIDFNTSEDSYSEYMPTMNSAQTETSGWDVSLLKPLHQGTGSNASTSMTAQSLQNTREIHPAATRSNFTQNQVSTMEEMNREEIQLTDTQKEDTPVENAVLLAARKAASAAAVQAAGTPDKFLLSRSSPSISLPKSRSFGRLAGRGSEASAMDLLQASFSYDDSSELLREGGSGLGMRTKGILSTPTAGSSSGDGIFSDRFLASSSVSKTPSLARGTSLGQSRQAIVAGTKASAMELLQASLGDEATLDGREAGNIGKS